MKVNLRQFPLLNLLTYLKFCTLIYVTYLNFNSYNTFISNFLLFFLQLVICFVLLVVSCQVLQQINLFSQQSIFVMYYIVVLLVFQALVFLFRNNSISKCGKKKPLLLIAPIAPSLARSKLSESQENLGTRLSIPQVLVLYLGSKL